MKKRLFCCLIVVMTALMFTTVLSFASNDSDKKPLQKGNHSVITKQLHDSQISNGTKEQLEKYVEENATFRIASETDPVTDGEGFIKLYYPEPWDAFTIGSTIDVSYEVFDTWKKYFTSPYTAIFDSDGNLVKYLEGEVADVYTWSSYSGTIFVDPELFSPGYYEFWIFNVPCSISGTPVSGWGSWTNVPSVHIDIEVLCDHVWDSGTVTKSPTCTATGIRTFTCSECGETKTETIPANGHKWKTTYTVDTPATYTSAGSESIHCEICGAIKEGSSRVIPMLVAPKPSTPTPTPAPTPTPTPADPLDEDITEQTGYDGTALGEGASGAAAEAAITSMKNDKDPAGSKFGLLQAKSVKQTKTSVTVTWKKVPYAKKYVIYGNKCGKSNHMQKQTTTGKTTIKFTKVAGNNGKKVKVKKGTYYKFLIVALDSDGDVVSSSKMIHVATKGGKIGNDKKVTTKAKKNKVSIKKGKTFKLGAKAVPASKKLKVKRHRKVAYESSNKGIATVNGKGVIKGKKKGTCYVYAYAQNGVAAKIKVTVK